MVAANSDLGIFGEEAVDALPRGLQRRIGQPVLFRIPEMDPRLIAHLDFDAERFPLFRIMLNAPR